MLRAYLINETSAPTREALVTTERAVGETILAGLKAQWAGYILMEDSTGMCAQWLVDETFTDATMRVLKTRSNHPGYSMRISVEPNVADLDDEIIDAD